MTWGWALLILIGKPYSKCYFIVIYFILPCPSYLKCFSSSERLLSFPHLLVGCARFKQIFTLPSFFWSRQRNFFIYCFFKRLAMFCSIVQTEKLKSVYHKCAKFSKILVKKSVFMELGVGCLWMYTKNCRFGTLVDQKMFSPETVLDWFAVLKFWVCLHCSNSLDCICGIILVSICS